MRRVITSATVALCFATAVAINAQDGTVTSKTKVKGDDVRQVTYRGCVQNGETQSYILSQALPVSTSTRVVEGTSGSVKTTSVTYVLVPTEKIEFKPYIGHQVEVTGLVLSGDYKTETKTKVEREHAEDTTVKTKTKIDDARPQLRVVSVKQLADKCTL